MEQKEAKVVLTIDYGTKKIGVCISETMTGHSKALPVVENNKNIFDEFDKIIADWLPNLCLIGVPSKASDEFLKSIKKFITEFEGKYRIKIVEAEEDFTSQAVANKKENEDFDSKSAELIFEGWFNQNYG